MKCLKIFVLLGVCICVSALIFQGPHTECWQQSINRMRTHCSSVLARERKRAKERKMSKNVWSQRWFINRKWGKKIHTHTPKHSKKATAGYDNMNVNPVLFLEVLFARNNRVKNESSKTVSLTIWWHLLGFSNFFLVKVKNLIVIQPKL